MDMFGSLPDLAATLYTHLLKMLKYKLFKNELPYSVKAVYFLVRKSRLNLVCL
jgi:hypothetical protein